MLRRLTIAGFLLIAGLTSVRADDTPAKDDAKVSKRRVYVLHSGIHTILSNPEKNIAAISIRDGLKERGVDEKNIVVLPNPFPTANWKSMFPVECFKMFAECSVPESKVSQEAYLRMHKSLSTHGVTEADNLVWVGHSAGGQMGLTMCYLACNLPKFPALHTSPAYHFDMVICLGSPICVKQLPDDVKLRHYYSPEDRVVQLASSYGPTAFRVLGKKLSIVGIPKNLPLDGKVRIFRDVEHPYWDVDRRVLDRIVTETDPACQPLWCKQCVTPSAGASLVHLINRALDEHYNITLEDLPGGK